MDVATDVATDGVTDVTDVTDGVTDVTDVATDGVTDVTDKLLVNLIILDTTNDPSATSVTKSVATSVAKSLG